LGKEILCLHNLPIPREITRCNHCINRQLLMRNRQSLMLPLRLFIIHLLPWCIMPRLQFIMLSLPWHMRLQVHMEDTGVTPCLGS